MPGDIVNAFRSALRYHRDRRGIFASNIAEAGGFLKTSPELARAGHPAPFLHRDSREPRPATARGARLLHARLRAAAAKRGNADARKPRSAGGAADRSGLLHASRRHRNAWSRDSGSRAASRNRRCSIRIAARRCSPPASTTDDEIRAVLRHRSDTIYHPVGTCRMGTDELAVVDPQASRARRLGIARRRCVDHADVDRRQHQRADDHDRRAGERSHPERATVMSAATVPPITDGVTTPINRHDVVTIRIIWVAFLLSLIVHIAALLTSPPLVRTLAFDPSDHSRAVAGADRRARAAREPAGSLAATAAATSGVTAAACRRPPPQRAAPRPHRGRTPPPPPDRAHRAGPRCGPAPPPRPTPPTEAQPTPRPPAETDLSSYIASRRSARGEAAGRRPNPTRRTRRPPKARRSASTASSPPISA